MVNMVTEKYFYVEPYLKALDAKVVAIMDKGLVLDVSIAYPEGGGQPGDRGSINGIPFTDTQKEGDAILHVMNTASFSVGDSVHLTLDWSHRYEYMQQHTAQHMLSGIMYTSEKIGTLSVHQGEDILTIETDRADISEETLFKIEDKVNRAICENHSVAYLEVSHTEAEAMGLRRSIKVSGDVRLVKIDTVDIIACGGIHTATTGEVGIVNYVGSELIRGHVRTMWRTGARAVRARRLNERAVHDTGALLSAPAERLSLAAERLISENKELSFHIRQLERQLAASEISSARSNKECVISTEIPLPSFQDAFTEGDAFIVIKDNGKMLSYLVYADEDVFMRFKTSAIGLGLKGGGRGHLFQGAAPAENKDKLIKAFQEVLCETR